METTKKARKSPALGATVKNWCFTLNNYTEADEIALQQSMLYSYLIYGHEVAPTTGTKHLQGYIQMCRRSRMSAVKKLFMNNSVHLEPAIGNVDQNIKYCSKGSDVITMGEPTRRGQRTDIVNLYDQVISCSKWDDVLKLDQAKRYLNYVQQVYNSKPPEKLPAKPWYPWQLAILDIIKGEPDDRSIYWVHDMKGGKGKTFLAKFIATNYSAFYSRPATNSSDLFCAYKNEKIVLLDVPRAIRSDKINYDALEALKDGAIFSSKYHSTSKLTSSVHVIVFSNHPPDLSMLSTDRLFIMDLAEDKPEFKKFDAINKEIDLSIYE